MASISYRKDRQRWQVSYQAPDGSQKRRSFRTKKQAEKFVEDVIVMRRTGGLAAFSSSSRIAFEEFAPQYLEWAKLNKRSKTYDNERGIMNAHLLPFFGGMSLSDVTVRKVERYKLKRQQDGVSNRTINVELTLLSVMMNRAVEWEYTHENPLTKVKRLKEAKKPPRYLSRDEVERLLDAAKETYLHSLILCAVSTGMRKQELYHLRWEDIDFEANTITVQSRDERPGRDAFTTKDYDFRTLEMTPMLRGVLEAERERRESEYVFTFGGKPLRWSCDKTLRRIRKKAEIENCTLHTLRSTFASHLAMAGVPIAHIQQLLGHDDYETTLVYAHLSTESHKGQVHRLPFAGNDGDA